MEKLKELKDKFVNNEWANPTWTDEVLSIMEDNEVAIDKKTQKRFPRVRGLRRIGTYLSGASIVCDVIETRDRYAACIAEASMNGFKVASATADATPENVNNEMISKHLLATAESRAEGRCWTKVLQLNCLTAEEMSFGEKVTDIEKNETIDIDEEVQWVSDAQKKMINNKAKKLDINSIKYAELLIKLHNDNLPEDETVMIKGEHIKGDKMSRKLASKVINAMDIVIKEQKEVPEDLKGFVSI